MNSMPWAMLSGLGLTPDLFSSGLCVYQCVRDLKKEIGGACGHFIRRHSALIVPHAVSFSGLGLAC